MNLQFPQGKMNTKKLARRCPYCKEYINKSNGTIMKFHLERFCKKNPANKKSD